LKTQLGKEKRGELLSWSKQYTGVKKSVIVENCEHIQPFPHEQRVRFESDYHSKVYNIEGVDSHSGVVRTWKILKYDEIHQEIVGFLQVQMQPRMKFARDLKVTLAQVL
jgi:hypothetical protein